MSSPRYLKLILLAGTLGVSTAAGAQNATRLVVVPNDPAGSAALSASHARALAVYDAFTVVEAAAGDVAALVAAGGDVRDDMRHVSVGGQTFDPAAPAANRFAKSGSMPAVATKGGYGLALVQYVGPLKDAWIAAVEATGVQVVTYMAQNAQLVAGDSAALAALSALPATQPFVRAVTAYTAGDKLRPGLTRVGPTQIVVSTVAGAPGASARAELARIATPKGDPVSVAGTVHQRVVVDGARIDEIAALGGVVAIEPFVEPRLLDERGARIIDGALNATFQPVLGVGHRKFLLDNGVPQSGTIVDVSDEGVDKGVVPVPAGSHPDFFVLGKPANASRLVYAQEATAADFDARDCGGHGTNVASIITGFNSGAGARISNNSWGAPVGGAYNTLAQEFDALVRDAQPGVAGNQQLVEVVAAGNSGAGTNTIASPGTAKNVITVGAAESVRSIGATDGCGVPDTGADSARDVIDFSSRGPTDDGRIKPDVVAPGTHVTGAQPQTGADYNGSGTCNPQFPAGSTRYTLVSGTSQAAPEISGTGSIVRSWYIAKLGGGSRAPSPAMTKAVLANVASDLFGGADGAGGSNAHIPTQVQGWGRPNLTLLFNEPKRQAIDQSILLTTTGTTVDRFFKIADKTRRLRVSLAWTDAPGPTVGNSFVNDLDLVVTAGAQVYRGNVFAAGRSVIGGSPDPRNNLENVFLPSGTGGPIKVRVVAKNLAGDGVPGVGDATDQDFALLVSNVGARITSTPVLTHSAFVATPLGDGDAVLEPGESFTLRETLRNVGNATATSVDGVLSANASDATVTQPNADWPNIATNAAANNSPNFRGTVKSALACGSNVRLAIAVTHPGATYNVPLKIPTGKPAATTVTKNSTNVPQAIPDNNAAGVTSDLVIGGTLIVADVNVTIGSLTHTSDQDLEIELRSPAGATVRLFNRHGGSGDNLTNTVFDDSAATPIASASAPFTGSFQPTEPLAAFIGQPLNGTWSLTVRDRGFGDTGTLQSWGITRKRFVCD